MKYLIIPIILLFTACAPVNKTNLTIQSKNQTINLSLKDTKTQYNFNDCTFEAYTIDANKFHIEYIEIKSSCGWNGLSSGYYRDFLNDYYKNLKTVSKKFYENIDLYFYELNNKYFYLLDVYDVNSDTFIIDYTGEIASKIDDKNIVIKEVNQIKDKFKKVMLDNDILENYFHKENSGKTIIIPK